MTGRGGLFFSLLSLLWLHRGHINSDSLSNRSLQPTDNKGCVAAYISFSLTLPTALCAAASKNPVSPKTPPMVAGSRQQISYLIFNAPPQCRSSQGERRIRYMNAINSNNNSSHSLSDTDVQNLPMSRYTAVSEIQSRTC